MKIVATNHVQLLMPEGEAGKARAFLRRLARLDRNAHVKRG
jgi:hypothetical protein